MPVLIGGSCPDEEAPKSGGVPAIPLRAKLAGVCWRDLVPMSVAESWRELALPLPWLAGALLCYARGWWVLALPCSFFFFLTGLRVAHGLQHYHLGLPRWMQDVALAVLSPAMQASLHAVQIAHLNHHRHCLDEADFEGAAAGRTGAGAILSGPVFIVGLHLKSWALASPAKRAWIAVELIGGACFAWACLTGWGGDALRAHVVVMWIGECLTGFFAVWSVHHHTHDAAEMPGRTSRGWAMNAVFFNMFYHAEHHLYPQVPTSRLGELAERIDRRTDAIARHAVWTRH